MSVASVPVLSMFQKLALVALFLLTSDVSGASIPCEDSGVVSGSSPVEWKPRTPEQTLYAYVRCLNDSTASVVQKINWVKWHPDMSVESQCYVKCVSEELRLYDVKERRFWPERFVQQAELFYSADEVELKTLKANADPMLSGVLEDNSCEAVFNKYATFYSTHTSTILRMFHGDNRDIGKTYQKLGDQVKQIGQTFVDFCETRTGAKWDDGRSCLPAALLDCVFRGFRWITEEGDKNVNEIRRDYESAGYGDETDRCESVMGGAAALYHCLHDKDADKLSKVVRERNQRTAFYFDITSQEEPWKSAVEFANNLA